MSAVLVTLANGIVSILNDPVSQAGLCESFTAGRLRFPEYDTSKITDLRVWVFGLSESIDFETRGSFEHRYGIRVAIYKRIADDAETDLMDQLREQVCDLLKTKAQLVAIGSNDAASLLSISNEPVYDPAQLEKFKTFASLITLTYIMPR